MPGGPDVAGDEEMIEMALQPWPQVRKNDKGHPVYTLQHLLRARGQTVTVDGEFGPKTDTAVKAFQKSAKLTVDGIVGPKTWAALVITVRRGDKGDAVRGVQEEFQARNQSGDPGNAPAVDGNFGFETETAVRGWQQFLHDNDEPTMAVDGIVGPMTWQSLISGMYLG